MAPSETVGRQGRRDRECRSGTVRRQQSPNKSGGLEVPSRGPNLEREAPRWALKPTFHRT